MAERDLMPVKRDRNKQPVPILGPIAPPVFVATSGAGAVRLELDPDCIYMLTPTKTCLFRTGPSNVTASGAYHTGVLKQYLGWMNALLIRTHVGFEYISVIRVGVFDTRVAIQKVG